MRNELKIGIGVGVFVIAGVVFILKNKNKNAFISSNLASSSTTEFDREKCAKEYALKQYPKSKKMWELNNLGSVFQAGQSLMIPFSELGIYQAHLANLNSIADDSDASFFCEIWKNGVLPNDLDSSIKISNLQKKYPHISWG